MAFSLLHRHRHPAPPAEPAEKGISDKDYGFIRDLVYQRSRINLGENKRELVNARLVKRLRATGLPTYAAYIAFIRTPAGDEERMHLIDAISTNHTSFMREIDHFRFLSREILPAAVQGAYRENEFRMWSAASSTGEEAYSAGLVMANALGEPPKMRWTCDCSDISTRVLQTAKNATYDASRLQQVPPDWVRRYFTQASTKPGESLFQVRPELRAHYRFHHLNLLGAAYPFTKPFHLIFCRNVMIYFDRPTQEELVDRLTRILAPGGYLLIGHAESLTGVKNQLKNVRPAIYRKPE
ncbi:MAG: protein-glutamate O-methyltransferase CheR [Opitutaceae bacterium]|nr:protein-glutamate O-methyltransferase CheR [Opitutaceae bacterium]